MQAFFLRKIPVMSINAYKVNLLVSCKVYVDHWLFTPSVVDITADHWCRSKSVARGALVIARGFFSCIDLYKKL